MSVRFATRSAGPLVTLASKHAYRIKSKASAAEAKQDALELRLLVDTLIQILEDKERRGK